MDIYERLTEDRRALDRQLDSGLIDKDDHNHSRDMLVSIRELAEGGHEERAAAALDMWQDEGWTIQFEQEFGDELGLPQTTIVGSDGTFTTHHPHDLPRGVTAEQHCREQRARVDNNRKYAGIDNSLWHHLIESANGHRGTYDNDLPADAELRDDPNVADIEHRRVHGLT